MVRYKSLNVGAVTKTGNACYDECRIESGREYCNRVCDTDINYLGGNNSNGVGINDQSGCGPNEVRCSVTNQKGEGVSICASNSAESCNEAAIDQGISVQIAYQGGNYGSGTWLCPLDHPTGNSCGGTTGGQYRPNLNPNSCFCGVL